MNNLQTLEESLKEALAKVAYKVIAVNRISKDAIRPVAGDETELTPTQVAALEKHGKKETIQGDEYWVLSRDYKNDVKAKTPNINKMGRTSGYDTLLFQVK